jgi:hypothetical protein
VSKLATLVIALTILAATALPGQAGVLINPNAINRPDGQGDQVIFYYDTRPNFTTFINLHNDSSADVTVRVLFYGPSLSSPLTRNYTIADGGTHIIDVGALASADPPLPAQFGVAIATAVNDEGKAIVSHGLSGNFTVANLQVHSAWGAPGAARSAFVSAEALVAPISSPLAFGTVIDGLSVELPPIQPTTAQLAVYYNPETLESPAAGGNQLIFITFEDVPSDVYSAQVAITVWSVSGTRENGSAVGPSTPFNASGVTVSDLATVAGSGVNGSSGSLTFEAIPSGAPINRLIFFTETLGTFGTGFLLPPVASAPPLV